MADVTVSTTAPKAGDRELDVQYDFGGAIADAVAKFGEEVVYSLYEAEAEIKLQAFVRGMLEKTGDKFISDDDIKAKVAEWKPGVVTRTKKDPVAAVLDKMSKMDESKKAEFVKALIAQLQAQAQA